MIALFVHGMGRSPLSGWPLLHRLRRAGWKTRTFRYRARRGSFAEIRHRLEQEIADIADRDEYILIGHSLGGVLLRAALGELPAETARPRHLFLLGSPQKSARLARQLATNPVFRSLTADCGAVLASEERMAAIGAPDLPATAIVGTRGINHTRGPFPHEKNDGIVSADEVSADWLTDRVEVPVVHALLPASAHVAGIILARMQQ